jgi:transcription elongation factor Elf1
MSFYETTEKKSFSEQKKTEFMDLKEDGSHFIRVLNLTAKKYYQHWIGGGIECLGDECPQCQQNRQILAEQMAKFDNDNRAAFKEATKIQGFNWRQERGAVNVLDRTPVKICPKCQAEVKAENDVFPASCSSCGTFISKVEINPLNKVKVFSRAGSVFEKIALQEKTKLDEEGNEIGLTNFDLEIIISGNNTIPRKTSNIDKVEVPEEELFDLDRAVIKLTAEEMLQKMRGVSLKDIFTARRATATVEEVEEVEEKDLAEIQAKIDQLFA